MNPGSTARRQLWRDNSWPHSSSERCKFLNVSHVVEISLSLEGKSKGNVDWYSVFIITHSKGDRVWITLFYL